MIEIAEVLISCSRHQSSQNAYKHTCIPTCMHAYLHACMHVYIHRHIHTHYSHKHISVCACQF